MALIALPFTFFPGTLIKSSEVNADFNAIYNEFNGNINQDNITTLTGEIAWNTPGVSVIEVRGTGNTWYIENDGDATFNDLTVNDITANSINVATAITSPSMTPIGSIIPFYDFNALVTFDPAYWTYCDGTVIVNASSPLNGQTLPDLSGRYLVGFGTDGGGDIGTALWATPAVGNANNQINISHSHTVNSHNHSEGNHNHRWMLDQGPRWHTWLADGVTHAQWNDSGVPGGPNIVPGDDGNNHNNDVFTGIGYYTELATGATTGNASPGTDSQLSSTQSIQPRSIRVRYIMRLQ